MTRGIVTPDGFGRDVLGPIVAEFCLRLWSLVSLMNQPDNTALLFCARGGLRMQLAYERFLAAAALTSPAHAAPLMVSRVVAIRPALLRTVHDGLDEPVPSVAATLAYEFPGARLSEVVLATTGVASPTTDRWDVPYTPRCLAALLRHTDGREAVEALETQTNLFNEHLHGLLGNRRHALLLDTGLYGTTRQLLADGVPAVDFSCALIARSYRPGIEVRKSKTFGLSVEAPDYSPFRRRTAMLRYWHFIEWLFEPELPSVRCFVRKDGGPRSNLETEGWAQRVLPVPGSVFAGVVEYLDLLPKGPAAKITHDAEQAWVDFRRAVVWPHTSHGMALTVGTRSHDFGTDVTWSERPRVGALTALRGDSMWREGAISRSGSPLRGPLLAGIETAYALRYLKRAIARRIGSAHSS